LSTYYFLPTRNVFGEDAAQECGDLLASLNAKKALIVTDAFLGTQPMCADVQGYLKDAGIDSAVFAGAEPNPRDTNVEDGLKVYNDEGCDALVSLGGGSAHDCCKGIGIVAANGGNIRDYEGIDIGKNNLPPYIAINTTAGTASEITRFCIITDTSRHVKMAILDWRCTPDISINDPKLMVGMPPSLTAATGMDALTHAVEAYVSTIATPMTDSTALLAISMIQEFLPKAVANGTNMVARDKMAYAQYLAGAAFNNASLGYVHAMAHQLGGFYDLPHGVCNAVLLPYVEDFNIIACADRFVDIAAALGENVDGLTVNEAAQQAIQAIKLLSTQVGIPGSLKELGVKPEDFDTLATNAMKDACAATNPRLATKDQIIAIYQRAYDGK
jgi:alcohol dehydrogenase